MVDDWLVANCWQELALLIYWDPSRVVVAGMGGWGGGAQLSLWLQTVGS